MMKFIALFTLIGLATAQYGAPSYDAPAAPAYNVPEPVPVYSAPETYDAPAPTYDAPAPAYDAPAPAYDAPAPAYDAPAPTYDVPAPTYDAPVYNAPAPAYAPEIPVYSAPEAYDAPTPTYDTPAPTYDTPAAPTYEYEAPAEAYAPAQQYGAVAAPEETSVTGGGLNAILPFILAGILAIFVGTVFAPLLGGLFAFKFDTIVSLLNGLFNVIVG